MKTRYLSEYSVTIRTIDIDEEIDAFRVFVQHMGRAQGQQKATNYAFIALQCLS